MRTRFPSLAGVWSVECEVWAVGCAVVVVISDLRLFVRRGGDKRRGEERRGSLLRSAHTAQSLSSSQEQTKDGVWT